MKAGRYIIGDLCYVFSNERWSEVCDAVYGGTHSGHFGKLTLKDGTEFVIYSTYWGDGRYRSSEGTELCVDSGTIGCVLVKDTDKCDCRSNMIVADFPEGFDHDDDDCGTLNFHDIIVWTNDDEMEDDEY